MAEEKNIANYTAADIEKYWKGKLSPAEMHAMEKAAMDDPFFADALEGYQYTNTADDDMTTLAGKINERTGITARVIPISTKQKKFNWLRVAAAIIIIGGAGILVQQLFFDQKNNIPIVDVKKQEEKKPEVATNKGTLTPDTPKTLIASNDSPKTKLQTNSTIVSPSNSNVSLNVDTAKYLDAGAVAEIKATADNALAKSSPSIAKQESNKSVSKLGEVKEKVIAGAVIGDSLIVDKRSGAEYKTKKPEAEGVTSANMRDRNDAYFLNNKYNFKVVDAQNNPVPFANVMNTRDNVGTYTDIRGNFNLVSSDSVMDVQIRSQGYLSNNYRLMPTTQTGALVLKEDDVARRQITQQNRQMVTSVTRKDSTEIEEPEVGWGNYNTYVQNNIQIPENIRGKKASTDVELSFDIDKNGQPINIKVTKSSQCKECDEEAKRLLKEGPKWKRKGKKSKTTISIAIEQ